MGRQFTWQILLIFFSIGTMAAVSAAPRPNVVLILADDLGFSDLGCYGGEIATPNLDRLASHGMRFSQFYNTARCWPTRAAILTGYYPQQVRRDAVPGVRSGGGGKRPPWAGLLPRYLKSADYRSYHSGKWHLDGMPIAQGFDRSYYLKDQSRFFNPKVHHRDDERLPPIELGTGFYGTTAIVDHTVACLQEHAAKFAQRPFFQYLAFAAPHFPLHALPADIEIYADRYNAGWDVIRQQRWERQSKGGWLGRASLSPVELTQGPPYHFPEALEILGPGEVNRPLPWDALTKPQRAFQSMKMTLHAAMIDRMDQEIGRVLRQLEAMEALENTLIVFLSDNGASAEIMVRADGHDPKAAPGSAATYLCLGPGWSTTCNTPFRKHKTWVHEGGTATPFIAHWPKGISSRGSTTDQVAHVIDLFPTIMELAGASAPEPGEAADAPPQRPGHSLIPTFGGAASRDRELWWQHEGNRAFRQTNWKIVAAKGDPWELYDLAQDRSETRDLAPRHPDRVASLAAAWEKQWEAFQRTAAQGPVNP